MEILGAKLGVPDAGKQLRDAVERELAPTPFGRVEGRPKVMLVISKDPLMVAGPDTFVGELMVIAGLQNAVEESEVAYPAWDREAIIKANPDWIIEASMENSKNGESTLWTGLESVAAIQNKHIRTVNPNWILRPGPRMGKGVRALREALKPVSREGR
jgi:iron complex transport system substrate-binding protein